MAEILGLASSIITVVGVAGKLGTSTIRLKRLWNEVQDVPASIRRCIEHLELLAPAIGEKHWISGHSTDSNEVRRASFSEWISKHDTGKFIAITQVIEWDTANPEEVLESISRGALRAHEIERCRTFGYRLQDLAIEYLHEYLNCSPWMEEWRLIVQTLFRNATWEDLAALHIDQIVKDIWYWQFPLGPFEKWLKRGLEMLKEDLNKAGVDLKELETSHGISRHQDQCELTTMEAMQWVSISTGDRSWDPFVEGLAGEFWYMIETTELSLPGSWVSDDEDDSSMFR